MATFKVGQRVRIIGGPRAGEEGVVEGLWGPLHGFPPSPSVPYPWDVRRGDGSVGPYMACELAPLTDPSADAFLARMKKLGSEPINEAPKVTERIAK